jgi:LPXTG-site transpeptidase (sortase) family protein
MQDSVTITVPKLPDTGFAPGIVTNLPSQPDWFSYTDLGDFWIEIPELGVKLPIVGVPLSNAGWNLTWLADQAGWLEGTAYPTHPGNSAITAHVYDAEGQPGPFINLNRLYWGHKVIVHLGAQKYVYEVREVRLLWPDDNKVFRHEEYSWLTLITCKDYNKSTKSYAQRIAVRAVLISVEDE